MDFKEITKREFNVINLLVKGLSNREIANKLFIEENSVKFHVTNIYKKVGTKGYRDFIARFYLEKHTHNASEWNLDGPCETREADRERNP